MVMSFLVTKLLGPAQEITSRGRAPVHVSRWIVFRSPLFEICLDHCDGEVSTVETSDYPDRFFCLGLAKSPRVKGPQPVRTSPRYAWMVLVGKQHGSARRKAAWHLLLLAAASYEKFTRNSSLSVLPVAVELIRR